jgi:hypothetical protein
LEERLLKETNYWRSNRSETRVRCIDFYIITGASSWKVQHPIGPTFLSEKFLRASHPRCIERGDDPLKNVAAWLYREE